MQVNDQVKVKSASKGFEEHIGRAGVITAVAGRPDEDQLCTVKLDETPTHDDGEEDFHASQLEFLGR